MLYLTLIPHIDQWVVDVLKLYCMYLYLRIIILSNYKEV